MVAHSVGHASGPGFSRRYRKHLEPWPKGPALFLCRTACNRVMDRVVAEAGEGGIEKGGHPRQMTALLSEALAASPQIPHQ